MSDIIIQVNVSQLERDYIEQKNAYAAVGRFPDSTKLNELDKLYELFQLLKKYEVEAQK